MKWVTLKGVKFDRTVSAWFIKRHLDPEAEFLFLELDEIPAAIEAGAQPFHNYRPTGSPPSFPPDRINFPKLIEMYNYTGDEAMMLLAQSVRGGERNTRTAEQQENTGLWAVLKGNIILSDNNDLQIVERMMPVYDAIYAFCQARIHGQTEFSDK